MWVLVHKQRHNDHVLRGVEKERKLLRVLSTQTLLVTLFYGDNLSLVAQ